MTSFLHQRTAMLRPAARAPRRCIYRAKLDVRATLVVPNPDNSAGCDAQPAPQAVIPSTDYYSSILMQSFGWDSCTKGSWYKQLLAKVPNCKAAGITHMWLPPPSQSVSPQGYMPGQLYNLTSHYGTKDELKQLCSALREAGIKPIADIVINHRCADEQVDGVWNKYRDDVTHEGKKIDWGKWAITSNDPNFQGTGNPDTGDDYGPAPDLDHLNGELRAALKEWLNWLKSDIGFCGWRLDFARGYGAQFAAEYIKETVGSEALNIAEYWVDLKWQGSDLEGNQDAARQKMVDWVNASSKTSCVFDFPTKGILQEAAKRTQYWRLRDGNGKAPGVIGWLPGKAVTFVDNHDTGSTQNHWPFPGELVGLGYAYILTHPGMPCIFYDHYFTWGDSLKNTINLLVKCRQRNEINGKSKLEILCAEADMYVARIDDKVMVKLGPRFDMGRWVPMEKDGWRFVASGKDFAVWEKKKD